MHFEAQLCVATPTPASSDFVGETDPSFGESCHFRLSRFRLIPLLFEFTFHCGPEHFLLSVCRIALAVFHVEFASGSLNSISQFFRRSGFERRAEIEARGGLYENERDFFLNYTRITVFSAKKSDLHPTVSRRRRSGTGVFKALGTRSLSQPASQPASQFVCRQAVARNLRAVGNPERWAFRSCSGLRHLGFVSLSFDSN